MVVSIFFLTRLWTPVLISSLIGALDWSADTGPAGPTDWSADQGAGGWGADAQDAVW